MTSTDSYAFAPRVGSPGPSEPPPWLRFLGLAEPANTVGVKLYVVHGLGLEQATKSVDGEFVFPAGDRNPAE